MATKKDSGHQFSFQVDQASINASVQALDRVSLGYKDIREAARQTGKALDDSGTAARNLDKIADATDDATRATRDLADAYDEVGKKALQAQRASESSAKATLENEAALTRQMESRARVSGDVESQVRALTGATGYFGGEGVEHIANYGAELLAVSEASQLLRLQLPELAAQLGLTTTQAGLAAGGLGLLAVGIYSLYQHFDKASESAEKYREVLEFQLQQGEETRAFLKSATAEEVNARIQETQAKIDQAYKELDINQALLDQLENIDIAKVITEGVTLEVPFGEDIVLKQLSDVDAATEKLQAAYEEQETVINQLTPDLNNMMEALGQGTTALNDATGAEQRRIEALQVSYEDQIAADKRVYDLTRTLTTDTAQERITALEAEAASIQTVVDSLHTRLEQGEAVSDLLAVYSGRLESVRQQTDELNQVILPELRARELETARMEHQIDVLEQIGVAREEEAQQAAAARERLVDASLRSAEILDDFTTRTAELEQTRQKYLDKDAVSFAKQQAKDLAAFNATETAKYADYLEKRGDILADASEDITTLESDAAKARVEAIEDFHKQDLQRAEDHQKRLLSIQQKLDDSLEDAADRRDAVAAAMALKQAGREERDAKSQFEGEQEQREDQLKEQLKDLADHLDEERQKKLDAQVEALADLKANYQKEKADRQSAYNAQRSERQQQHREQLNDLRQQWSDEDAQRRTQRDKQLADLVSALKGETETKRAEVDKQLNIVQAGYSQMTAAAANWANSLMATLSGRASVAASQSGSTWTNPNAGSTSLAGRSTRHYAGGGAPPVGEWVTVGEHGRETALFTDPAYIYRAGQEVPLGNTINLDFGGLMGGITIQQQGQSPRQMFAQIADQVGDMVESVLIDNINAFQGVG